jgi:hypothetical protein
VFWESVDAHKKSRVVPVVVTFSEKKGRGHFLDSASLASGSVLELLQLQLQPQLQTTLLRSSIDSTGILVVKATAPSTLALAESGSTSVLLLASTSP